MFSIKHIVKNLFNKDEEYIDEDNDTQECLASIPIMINIVKTSVGNIDRGTLPNIPKMCDYNDISSYDKDVIHSLIIDVILLYLIDSDDPDIVFNCKKIISMKLYDFSMIFGSLIVNEINRTE